MKNFISHLETTQEVGFVEEVLQGIVHVAGLPSARNHELVIFETGQAGQVISLHREFVEIMLFSKDTIRVGTRATRTNALLEIPVGTELLGQTIDPLGYSLNQARLMQRPKTTRVIDAKPSGISLRKRIQRPFETGLTLVDMLIPLGRGQRELVIGDRKTGKTSFLLQSIVSQAQKDSVCIYAAIGKKKLDIKKVEDYFVKQNVMKKTIIVAASLDDPAGIIYLAPYAGMTIAEYFRDQGQDVLIVLDDLFTHAKFYREISLLGKKFPGRNSYPGDIFYTHARLLERAGNFILDKEREASITCLAVAETQSGDLSGYIQTNLMSMTDGHIYFDNDLFSQGRRPAINPFLSVTRVGRQTQTDVQRQINRELISFLTLFDKMQSFSHFGAEATASVKHTLATGEKIYAFFDQTELSLFPTTLQIYLFCLIWSGVWETATNEAMIVDLAKIVTRYRSDPAVKKRIDDMVNSATSFNGFLQTIRTKAPEYLEKMKTQNVIQPVQRTA